MDDEELVELLKDICDEAQKALAAAREKDYGELCMMAGYLAADVQALGEELNNAPVEE